MLWSKTLSKVEGLPSLVIMTFGVCLASLCFGSCCGLNFAEFDPCCEENLWGFRFHETFVISATYE